MSVRRQNILGSAIGNQTSPKTTGCKTINKKSRGYVQTCTPTHTPQEMTQTSAYCPVRSINCWAVSNPAIHHVSAPLCPLPFVIKHEPKRPSLRSRWYSECYRWCPFQSTAQNHLTVQSQLAHLNLFSQNVFFSDEVALWILAAHWGKRGHAQGLMPTKDCQGPSFCLEAEPLRWTKSKLNTRSFLTIRLLNGPLMFHKKFELSYLQCKGENKAFIIQQLTQQHVAKVRCCDKKCSHEPVQKQVTLCLPGVGTVSDSAIFTALRSITVQPGY